MVAVHERPNPIFQTGSENGSPTSPVAPEFIKRVDEFIALHPKGSPFILTHAALATGRSHTTLYASVGARLIAEEIGYPFNSPEQFREFCLRVGPPNSKKQEHGRQRAYAMHGNGVGLAPSEVLMDEPTTNGDGVQSLPSAAVLWEEHPNIDNAQFPNDGVIFQGKPASNIQETPPSRPLLKGFVPVEEVARLLGVSRTHWYRIEEGHGHVRVVKEGYRKLYFLEDVEAIKKEREDIKQEEELRKKAKTRPDSKKLKPELTEVQPARERKKPSKGMEPFIPLRPTKSTGGAVSAKPAGTVELGNVGPYTFTPEEVYVLAFALCTVNRLKDEEDLGKMGLRLSEDEFTRAHSLVSPKNNEGKLIPIPVFDLKAVVAQVRGKLANFVVEREDVLSQNDSRVVGWLLRRFAGFRDKESLDKALMFMFQTLEELGMGEYFRRGNIASPKPE